MHKRQWIYTYISPLVPKLETLKAGTGKLLRTLLVTGCRHLHHLLLQASSQRPVAVARCCNPAIPWRLEVGEEGRDSVNAAVSLGQQSRSGRSRCNLILKN